MQLINALILKTVCGHSELLELRHILGNQMFELLASYSDTWPLLAFIQEPPTS